MEINPYIFRAYDIRGIVDKDLNPEIVELIGKAYGTFLQKKGTKDVLIGRDARPSSQEYQDAITKGILSTGCNVADIGLTLSSILYFARQKYKIDGAVMVTASHNPVGWNGFKLCQGLNAIVDKEIKEVYSENKGKISETTNKYIFETIEEAKNFIEGEVGKKRYSNILEAEFEINNITKSHLFGPNRSIPDQKRRAKLLGPAIEILEDTGLLVAIDKKTDKKNIIKKSSL